MFNPNRSCIAIIEDEPFMADLIHDMLGESAADAEIFLLANEFIRCPDPEKFDVILLDLSLPDIDGFDFMERLSTNAAKSRILLMSGHDASILEAAALYATGLGLQTIGTLQKPFSRQDLFDAIGLPC